MRTYKPIPCRECGVTIVPTGPMVKWCKPCARERMLKRHRDASRIKVLRKYNMTVEQYEVMLAKQGGVCAICQDPPEEGKNLYVDHDHSCCPGQYTCGECVRGLLCSLCNTAFEQFNKNPEGFGKYRAMYYDRSAEDGIPF